MTSCNISHLHAVVTVRIPQQFFKPRTIQEFFYNHFARVVFRYADALQKVWQRGHIVQTIYTPFQWHSSWTSVLTKHRCSQRTDGWQHHWNDCHSDRGYIVRPNEHGIRPNWLTIFLEDLHSCHKGLAPESKHCKWSHWLTEHVASLMHGRCTVAKRSTHGDEWQLQHSSQQQRCKWTRQANVNRWNWHVFDADLIIFRS